MSIPTVHKCDPAFKVIQKLGGKSAVADALDLDKSTLSRWCQNPPRGTGGAIPQRHWPHLLSLARKLGVKLKLQDLAAL